ncbi:MAG: GNAT family N-acetyltransferase [Bacteriovoracia bacterium]
MAEVVVRSYQKSDAEAVKAIFWETSSRRDFPSTDERLNFEQKYLTSYFVKTALVAIKDEQVVGYIICDLKTSRAEAYWSEHLALFEDLYERYPAHLHINCTESVRGMGVGALLVEELLRHLRQLHCPGVHLITLGGARNVSFYLRHGFSHRVERLWKGKPLLLLGQTL